METVTISPKYQVVIPKSVREQLGLLPGQEVHVLAYRDRIEFIPVRPIKEMRGMLAGIDTNFERDREDRV
jgi:AbrB family looped-hinge helix DNA binding protein